MHLGFVRHQLSYDPPKPQRFFAECGPHPVVSGCRRVTFIEDEIDDLQNRGQPTRKLRAAWNFERNLRFGERSLGANDSLCDGRLGTQVGAGNLVGGESAQKAQGEGHSGFRRKDRMARNEYQPQHVVTDVVIHGSSEIGNLQLAFGHLAAEVFVFAVDQRAAAKEVDGSMLCRTHQPGSGIVGYPGLGPLLESSDQSVLREFLGYAHVADDTSQPGNHPGRLDLPDGFDGAMCLGGNHCLPITSFSRLSAQPRTAGHVLCNLHPCLARRSGAVRTRLRRQPSGSPWPAGSPLPWSSLSGWRIRRRPLSTR